MKYSSPLVRGTLIRRYRRFLVDVRLEQGETVTAHCPNSGTLRGCSEPGSTVLLSDSRDAGRRHPLTWELVEINGTWVCIHSLLCRKIIFEAIERRIIPSLTFFHEIQRDVTYGHRTKVDVMLYGMERNGFVNLYNVTWAEHGIALFPDVVHVRAQNSLRQLTEIAKQGHHAAAFFLVQRADCTVLKPAEQVDRDFMKTMLAAQSAGVEILAYRADVSPEAVRLGIPIPYSLE